MSFQQVNKTHAVSPSGSRPTESSFAFELSCTLFIFWNSSINFFLAVLSALFSEQSWATLLLQESVINFSCLKNERYFLKDPFFCATFLFEAKLREWQESLKNFLSFSFFKHV